MGSGSEASFTAFGWCLYLPCLIRTPSPRVSISGYQPLPLAVGVHCRRPEHFSSWIAATLQTSPILGDFEDYYR